MKLTPAAQALVKEYLDEFKADYNKNGPDCIDQWKDDLADAVWLETKCKEEDEHEAYERAYAVAEEAVEEMYSYIDTRPYYDEPFMCERNPLANWAPRGF